MSLRSRVFLFSFSFALAGAAWACDPAPNEPPPQTPKSSLPPDKTEVTMELSTATPPGEPAPATPAPNVAGSSSAATPATTGPDPSEDPMIGGVQSDASVEKAVAPLRPRLRVCYKKALAANPNIGAGSATFDATIGGKDGHVASARFVKRDGLDEDMVGCLLVAVKAMTFDASRKSQIVTLTFGKPAPATPAAGDAGTKG